MGIEMSKTKMMPGEEYVFNLLMKHNKNIDWKFFEIYDTNNQSVSQAKQYGGSAYWTSYPDFEGYINQSVVILIEVKEYDGYFQNWKNAVGMKYSHFKAYQTVQKEERVPVRFCFVITQNDNNKICYWENLYNIINFKKKVEEMEFPKYDSNGRYVGKEIKYGIIWDCRDFRTDIENLATL
jgi:hypothetical protein